MEADLATLLDRIRREGVEHDAATPDRRDRYRNLEPDSGAFLNVLVRAIGAHAALELGTSTGYSTLCIADALRTTGGRLLTVDVDEGRSARALEHLREAGLESVVDVRVADAGVTLQQQLDASLDFVFLDAERDQYVAYWPHLRRTLRPGGLLAVD
ncbi:MAG TPA: class I SAM-dependent methyltransferase, partial [Luteitalea sp.]|nr:class I SAM-dependent methyltransferase [Luteitalea sp.]